MYLRNPLSVTSLREIGRKVCMEDTRPRENEQPFIKRRCYWRGHFLKLFTQYDVINQKKKTRFGGIGQRMAQALAIHSHFDAETKFLIWRCR